MKTSRSSLLIPILGALALAACDGGDPMDPFTEEALAEEDEIALSVLAEPAALEAALALVDVPLTTTARRGFGQMARANAQGDATRARQRFLEAQQALGAHEPLRAAERAREARGLVARAALAAGGPEAAAALLGRLNGLALAVGRERAGYFDGQGLERELQGLGDRARQRLHQGDTIGALERAILGEQRHRQRQRDPEQHTGGAAVLVELGGTAVALATRLVEAAGADDEQLRLLDVAAEYAREAQAALDAGDARRAAHLADLAHWAALQAVVWPDGVSDEDARAMLELAESAYAAALAGEPTELEALVLTRARALIDHGIQILEQASPRGIGALWRAAVACEWTLS